MEQVLSVVRLLGYFITFATSTYSFYALRGTLRLGSSYPFMQSIAVISGTISLWALAIFAVVLMNLLNIETGDLGAVIATFATAIIAGGMSVVAWNIRKKRLDFIYTVSELEERELDSPITVRSLFNDWKTIVGIVGFALFSTLGYYLFSTYVMPSYIVIALVMVLVGVFAYLSGRRR